jgi:hypothetical protein
MYHAAEGRSGAVAELGHLGILQHFLVWVIPRPHLEESLLETVKNQKAN